MKVIKINDWLFQFPWIITAATFFFPWEYIQTTTLMFGWLCIKLYACLYIFIFIYLYVGWRVAYVYS